MSKLDLAGVKVGRLTILEQADPSISQSGRIESRWVCRCDCGVVKNVLQVLLRSGGVFSCGCALRYVQQNQPVRENAYNWKGGRRIDDNGYVNVYLPQHSRARSNGYIKEHTLVMECHLDRFMLPGESVHHKNGDKTDNRIENLELWSTSQPPGQRVEDKFEWAVGILELYDPDYPESVVE